MPIHLKEDLIVELVLMHKYGNITVLYFSKYAIIAQYLHKGSPTENYVSLWISGKSTVWLRMTILKINVQLALCQTQHNIWQGNLCSANLTALWPIIVCRWRTNGQLKGSHSILLAELLPTRDMHKVLADLCLLFQVSCVSTRTQSSKLTNELNTWTTLKSQPIMLRTSPGTFGQSSSSFVKQDWSWQLRSSTLESDKLNS